MSRKRDFFGKLVTFQHRFNHYYDFLRGLALSVYKWENLPESIDSMFMERTLLDYGNCLVFNEDVLNQLVCMKFAYSGQLDIYNLPTRRNAYASNGYNRTLNERESVIIWDNNTRISIVDNLCIFANRLAMIEQTIDININAQRTPYVIECSKNERFSLDNAFKQVVSGEPVVKTFKGSDNKQLKDKLNVMKLDAPYLADKLEVELEKIWNTALTYIGIPNVRVEKSQYMSADEVDRRMGGALIASVNRLMPREIACEQINSMFNTNISVRHSINAPDQPENPENNEGGR